MAQQQMTDEQRRELEEKIKNMSPEELKEFQKQQCIFCQIIAGKIPSKKVYEDEICYAVMDINPAAIGHVLLFPKEHYAIMPLIPENEVGHMFAVAKHLSQAMLKRLGVEGTNIFVANGMVAGQKAQHFMIHVIPRKEDDGVLDIPGHLVDEAMREKIGVAVGNKMNQLMGIKKEKVKMEKEEGEGEKEEMEEEEPTSPPPAADQEETEDEEKEESDEVEEPEEVKEESEEEKPKKKKAKKKAAKKKPTSKKEAPDHPPQEEVDGDKDVEDSADEDKGADLDDIAELFK